MIEPFVPPETQPVRDCLADLIYMPQVTRGTIEVLLDAIDTLVVQRDLLVGSMRVNAIALWAEGRRILAAETEVFTMDVLHFPHTAIRVPEKDSGAYAQMLDGQSALHKREADFDLLQWLEEVRPEIREKVMTHRTSGEPSVEATEAARRVGDSDA